MWIFNHEVQTTAMISCLISFSDFCFFVIITCGSSWMYNGNDSFMIGLVFRARLPTIRIVLAILRPHHQQHQLLLLILTWIQF